MNQKKRILIVRTDRIGDLVLTLPIADIIRTNYPDAQIVMLVREYTSELVSNSNSVDKVILYDRNGNLIPFFKMLGIIKMNKFDIAIIVYPTIRLALLCWLARIQIRVGTGYRLYSILFNKRIYEHRKDAKKHELEYNLNLLTAINCNIPKVVPPWIKPTHAISRRVKERLIRLGIDLETDYLVLLHPGSGGSTRTWCIENFSKLGKLISTLPNIKIIITGGKGEEQLARKLENEIGNNAYSIANEFSLLEYTSLASFASLFIGNSTGPLHIAAAVGTAVVGFFPQIKSMNATRWGPYTEKKIIFTPIGKPQDCKKCIRHINKCECMESIEVEEVFNAILNYLKNTKYKSNESI